MTNPTPPVQPGSGTTDAARAGASEGTERAILRRALRDTLVLLGALLVLGVGIGALVAGLPGVYGALVGVGLAAFFCATTVWSMMRTVGSSPTTMAAVVMGAWIAKVIVLIVVLALLRGADFYDRWVLLAVLTVGALGAAVLDYRAVRDGRLPYVQP